MKRALWILFGILLGATLGLPVAAQVGPGRPRFPGILSIASGKTFTVNNTLTIAATDGITMTTPTTSFTAARTDAANTFTLANDTTNTITGGSVTGSGTSAFLGITGTFNTSGVAAAVRVNITNTSGASAKLLDLLVSSGTKFDVSASGVVRSYAAGSTSVPGISVQGEYGIGTASNNLYLFGTSATTVMALNQTFIAVNPTTKIGWATSNINSDAGDTFLARDSAGVLALRNSTAAQTFRLYETFTDASNYSRLSISAPASGPITFASEAAGTGTARAFSFTGGTLKATKFLGGGSAPAVSNTSANSCGTTSATIVGTDAAGKVTVGATSGTSCTVTFSIAYANAPACSAADETTAMLVKPISTTTTVILSATAFVAGDVVAYNCIGY